MPLTTHPFQSHNSNGRSHSERPKIVLAIGGSDPTGGAGIQADLKTFQHLGIHGLSILTAITVQNTSGVISTNPLTTELVREQLDELAKDIRFDAIKIGMLTTAEVVHLIAEFVSRYNVPTVLDPILASSNGIAFLEKDAIEAVKEELLPLVTIMTPNLGEASLLGEIQIDSEDSIIHTALILHDLSKNAVLIKGGHGHTEESRDLFCDGLEIEWLSAPRNAKQVHGTGCVLASAIASELAKKVSLRDAVLAAKEFITSMLERAMPIGSGQEIFQYPPLFLN
jgi:hydroxymethylpyrimidine/phosphomethylpyrimidine kinase